MEEVGPGAGLVGGGVLGSGGRGCPALGRACLGGVGVSGRGRARGVACWGKCAVAMEGGVP